MVLHTHRVALTYDCILFIYRVCNNFLFIINLSHTCGLACMLISTIPLFLMEKGKYNLGNGGHRHSFYSTFGLFSGIAVLYLL